MLHLHVVALVAMSLFLPLGCLCLGIRTAQERHRLEFGPMPRLLVAITMGLGLLGTVTVWYTMYHLLPATP